MIKQLDSLRRAGLAAQSAVLAATVAVGAGLVTPVAAWLGGLGGAAAAAVAAALCLLGAEVALALAHLFRGPDRAWRGMLAGMFPRMGIPLILGLAVQLGGGVLAENGVLVYLVVFYPLTLSVELALSLPPAESVGAARGTGKGVP
jgi:hypothetical protein